MIIKQVKQNKTSGQLIVFLPKHCDLIKGDYVKIIKIEEIKQ